MFHGGQLVLCVDDKFCHPSWRLVPHKPHKGAVYTVRDIFKEEHFTAVLLLEIQNAPRPWAGEPPYEMGFPIKRFRPVDDSKLEIFRAMLTDKPMEVVDVLA